MKPGKAAENVALPLTVSGRDSATGEANLTDLLSWVGLSAQAEGAIDGVTGEATPTEDGFAAAEGRDLVSAALTLLQAERTP